MFRFLTNLIQGYKGPESCPPTGGWYAGRLQLCSDTAAVSCQHFCSKHYTINGLAHWPLQPDNLLMIRR